MHIQQQTKEYACIYRGSHCTYPFFHALNLQLYFTVLILQTCLRPAATIQMREALTDIYVDNYQQ